MDTLTALSDYFAHRPELLVAIAFGSVVRGDAGHDSDLDAALLADHALSGEEKLALIDELATISGRPVDLLDLYDLHGPVLGRLLREGQVLLRRDNNALAGLYLRALYDEADFLPYRRRILDERRRAWIGN